MQGQSELGDKVEGMGNKLLEAIPDIQQPVGVVWSYGTGIPGSDEGQLNLPTYAEEIDGDKVLIADNRGYRVILVDKITKNIVWTYTETIGGSNLSFQSARQIKSGDYQGDILLAGRYHDGANYRGVLRIIGYGTTTKKWETETAADQQYVDAILWDNDHIMVSLITTGTYIVKIKLADKTEPWSYTVQDSGSSLRFLQKLPGKTVYDGSYGGDLIYGTDSGYVREIDTADSSTKWQYGIERHGVGEVYEGYEAPQCPLRVGVGEHLENTSAITYIACYQTALVTAVTKDKNRIWQIGGVSQKNRAPSPQGGLMLLGPSSISLTRAGNLLIADGLGCKVIEINPNLIPQRQGYEFATGATTTNDWVDSEIMEVREFGKKNIIISNIHETNSADWKLLGSPDANTWIEIKTSAALAAEASTSHLVETPWAFIKVQTKSTNVDASATVGIWIHCQK